MESAKKDDTLSRSSLAPMHDMSEETCLCQVSFPSHVSLKEMLVKAHEGDTDAMLFLSYCGLREWLRRASDLGNIRAMRYVCESLCDERENFSMCCKIAEAGCVHAMVGLGNMYYYGRGVEQRFHEAEMWFRRAAEKGNTAAMCNLGVVMSEEGYDGRNDGEAIAWFHKAAERGNLKAMCNLADMLIEGAETEKDEDRAMMLYRRAYDGGHTRSFERLASMLSLGLGTHKGVQETTSLLRSNALRGNSACMLLLGKGFLNGAWVKKDAQEGAKWLKMAKEEGIIEASDLLDALDSEGQSEDAAFDEKDEEGGTFRDVLRLEISYDPVTGDASACYVKDRVWSV